MEERKDRTVLIAVVTGVITLLLGACLGTLAGGVGGYFIGRQAGEQASAFSQNYNPRGISPAVPVPSAPQPFDTPAPRSATATGVVVQEVVSGSPAEVAGIKAGDVLIEMDGVPLDANHRLSNLMAQHRPGDTVKVTIIRDGQTQTLQVELGARIDSTQGAYLGIRYQDTPAPQLQPLPTP